ncbi:MAG: type II toxin-antitoxin system RelB/DinJ family antitoxin [Chromatiaceae bacterium]|nr:type II toxin-antitoxin system RelB/DinJ family antitoxin [Chromatiaceae bacterium]
MPAAEVVCARIDKKVIAEASAVLEAMGLSMADAIRLLLVRVAQDKALPFEIRVPNRETAATLEATDRGEGLVRCQDANDLFAKLGL